MCTERSARWLAGLTLLVVGLAASPASADPEPGSVREQVMRTEQAFARSMAERDFAAFRSFLSPEAIFFSGDTPLRGAAAVAAAWKTYFDGPEAPFSWRPETVEVLESGALALSSGPVFDPSGQRVGAFNSIWRRGADGAWKIVFDKGEKACAE